MKYLFLRQVTSYPRFGYVGFDIEDGATGQTPTANALSATSAARGSVRKSRFSFFFSSVQVDSPGTVVKQSTDSSGSNGRKSRRRLFDCLGAVRSRRSLRIKATRCHVTAVGRDRIRVRCVKHTEILNHHNKFVDFFFICLE